MTTTVTSTAIVVADPAFSDPERFALAGFLAGYSGLTRDAYALDLRQFAAWCDHHNLRLFQVRRADIECFGRAETNTNVSAIYFNRDGGRLVVGRGDGKTGVFEWRSEATAPLFTHDGMDSPTNIRI